MIVWWIFDRFLVDERRGNKSKDEQRSCCPTKKIHPGRTIPIKPCMGRAPEPKVFYTGREWFETDIEEHHKGGGDAHEPKTIRPGLAPRTKHQPSNAACAENGREPNHPHSPPERL